MAKLVIVLLVGAALVILALQNLTPVLPLVVAGQTVGPLPLSLWLLIAISAGTLCTLVIYRLVPQRRGYRPLGQRVSPPLTPEPAAAGAPPQDYPDNPPQDRFVAEDSQGPQETYGAADARDRDWAGYGPPDRWEDWDQSQRRDTFVSEPGTAVDRSVRDIESGWGDEDYDGRYARRETPPEPPPDPSRRDWIYDGEPEPFTEEDYAPYDETEDDVYDASYRVIIPPYDPPPKNSPEDRA